MANLSLMDWGALLLLISFMVGGILFMIETWCEAPRERLLDWLGIIVITGVILGLELFAASIVHTIYHAAQHCDVVMQGKCVLR